MNEFQINEEQGKVFGRLVKYITTRPVKIEHNGSAWVITGSMPPGLTSSQTFPTYDLAAQALAQAVVDQKLAA